MSSFSRAWTSELEALEDEDNLLLRKAGDRLHTELQATIFGFLKLNFEKLGAENSRVEKNIVFLAKTGKYIS
jgi:hypothetical protein